ncbi:MAG: type VI secretion system baseplate subunit TssG, partial [Acidobacteria bacterium]|nr:type VI secretion system baseplate subunit TssG [Acidobacteriota bacterium]
LLSGHFQVPVSVEPFEGRWFPLEPSSRTLLARRRDRNQVLGKNAVLGRRVWIQDAAYRLRIGPLKLSQYLDLLPVGGAFAKLCELARFYDRDELGFSVRLVLAASEVPRLNLGRAGDSRLGWSARLEKGPTERSAEARLGRSGSTRLGWTSWLRGEKPPKQDATLTLQAQRYLAGVRLPWEASP